MQMTTEVIGDERVTCFAVPTDQLMLSLLVAATLDHEIEVDGDALITDDGSHRCSLTGGLFAELGGQAQGAIFKGIGNAEFWH